MKRQCDWTDVTGRCQSLAVLTWKWIHTEEHYCAHHYDFYAKLYLENADEYPDVAKVVRKNGLKR